MSNIPSNQQVARLRELHAKIMKGETAFVGSALQDAANEIERQHAALTGERGPTETKSEVEHLRDALGTVRKYLEGTSMATWIDGFFNGKPPKYSAHDYERVIAAGGNGWSTLERLRDMAMENHGFAHETSTDDPSPGSSKTEVFNAGVTQAKYRRYYYEALLRVLNSDRMLSHDIARAAICGSPEETESNPVAVEGRSQLCGQGTNRATGASPVFVDTAAGIGASEKVYCSQCGQEDRDCYCDPSRPPEKAPAPHSLVAMYCGCLCSWCNEERAKLAENGS